jgi:phosphoglucomutase
MTPSAIIEKAKQWLKPPFDSNTQSTVQSLIAHNQNELTESFYTDLDFGTGGLRGIMGIGTNRVNKYTLGQATQGLSNYLRNQVSSHPIKVAIAHDCRNNSDVFARDVAGVLAGNGIEVYLYEALRPTPLLSFAVRHLGCHAGIVLTASHNPKEYNGYKVYWNDGGQLVPPHDKGVIEEVRKVSFDAIKFDGPSEKIHSIGKEVDDAYLNHLDTITLSNTGKSDLKIIFTNLHGTAGTILPEALKRSGFANVQTVAEQDPPDGNFPTVQSPNPEEGAALQMAVDLAEQTNSDLVIGCDPDADRVGIAVRDLDGKMVLLNGNQAASVLIYYVLEQHHKKGSLQQDDFVAATVVTTDLIAKMAESYGVTCHRCLTGFKWIAEIIRNQEGKGRYLAGGEESYGYLVGDFVRDKDAIGAAVMLAEVAAWAKGNGSSLFQILLDVYQQFGFYLEDLISITKKGKDGAEAIANMMQDLRANTPTKVAGIKVEQILDYKTGIARNMSSGHESKIGMPASNVIQLLFEDGSKITARPSGTEPKIKFYISVNASLDQTKNWQVVQKQLQQKIAAFREAMQLN